MDLLLWIAVGFFLIGLIVLIFIKRKIQNHNTESMIWFIVATTIWGAASIILFAWWFNTI
jgi:hypothetical protein